MPTKFLAGYVVTGQDEMFLNSYRQYLEMWASQMQQNRGMLGLHGMIRLATIQYDSVIWSAVLNQKENVHSNLKLIWILPVCPGHWKPLLQCNWDPYFSGWVSSDWSRWWTRPLQCGELDYHQCEEWDRLQWLAWGWWWYLILHHIVSPSHRPSPMRRSISWSACLDIYRSTSPVVLLNRWCDINV